MSLKDCMIKNGFTEKEIDEITGGEALSETQFQEAMIKAQKESEATVKKAKIQMLAIDSAVNAVKNNPNSAGHGLLSLLAFEKRKGRGVVSVESMSDQYARMAFAEMSDMMEKLMPKTNNGWQVDDALRANIVKEIFLENTGDVEAKAFASSFVKANENLRLLHNKLGGDIKKLDQWNLPQSHNGLKIRKASKSQWVDELLMPDVLDLNKMINKETEKAFKSTEELRPYLEKMYDNIVTDGASKMDWEAAVGASKGRGLTNRKRFLKFKTGESYLNYQNKYGEDNIYSAMITHIKTLANETALIKQFGPNYAAGFEYVKAQARIATPPGKDRLIGRAENVMRELTGELSGKNSGLQSFTETFRALNVFKLGGASISAFSDQGSMAIAAKMFDLPVLKNSMNFLKQMASGKEERQFLLQSGVNADYVIDIASGLSRFGENDANSAWGKFAAMPDRFIRLTGLNKMTEAGRSSIQISALGHLASIEKTAFKDLSAGNQRMLAVSNITESDWNIMRKSKKQNVREARYLDLRELPTEVQAKVSNMMDVLAYRAIPAPDAEVRAMLRQGTESGTAAGELFRSMGQFKSFGVSIMLYNIEFSKQFGRGGQAAYLAGLFVTMSMFGMVSLQAKQLVAGKETMKADNPKTWIAAMAQGGGLGIFADFLFKDQSRFGSSMITTLAGPTIATMETLLTKLLLAPTQKAAVALFEQDGDAFEALARQYGVDLTDELRKTLPTQLWYTKLLFDRYVFQTISQLADPEYITKLHKKEAKLQRDEGRGMLFQPIEL